MSQPQLLHQGAVSMENFWLQTLACSFRARPPKPPSHSSYDLRSFQGDVGQDVGKRKIIAALNYWTILRHGPFWPDPEHINNSPPRAALLTMESKHMTHLSRQIRAHNANDSSNPNYDHAVALADRVCPSAIVSSLLIPPLQHEAT